MSIKRTLVKYPEAKDLEFHASFYKIKYYIFFIYLKALLAHRIQKNKAHKNCEAIGFNKAN